METNKIHETNPHYTHNLTGIPWEDIAISGRG